MQKIILDTDIGDDIDDVLALAFVLSSPEFELLGVTTVFGNTFARTPLARKISESIAIWQSYVQSVEPDRLLPILPVMHDPLAVATMIDSSIVDWRTGEVSVELNKDKIYGLTVFQEKDNGAHRYAYKVNPEAMISLWMERIT